jgi:hypothetical protein
VCIEKPIFFSDIFLPNVMRTIVATNKIIAKIVEGTAIAKIIIVIFRERDLRN